MDRENHSRVPSNTDYSKDNDTEATPAPSNRPVTDRNNGDNVVPMQKLNSATSHVSMERSWSLNDGYSCGAVDEEDTEEAIDREAAAAVAAAGGDESFAVRWEESDAMNPRNLSSFRKWLITVIVSLGSLCVTCTSSMYTTTYGQITKEFHISRIVATLGLSFFIWGLGIGPLLLGPLSEFYGRRNIYLASFTVFLLFIIPCAVAKNVQTMLVCRFFNGVAGSAFLSVAGGTVGDMFDRQHLGPPMMLYTASPFVGPVIGPLVGGFVNEFTLWRWSFYVLLIWAGALLLRNKARKLRKETGDDRWIAPIEKMQRSVLQTVIRSIYRPILLLILEPMCLNLCIFSAILLGILYLFFGAFELVFSHVYGFGLWQCGCTFLGLLVGMVCAILTDPLWRRNYARLERNHQEKVGRTDDPQPEWRLPPAIGGAPLVTIGMFIFAWTIYPNVHWIGPIIGSAVFAAGMILVYTGIFTFLVDAYPLYAASALSANSFARSSFGGVFPLFGIQMYNRLNYHWATSLLAFLTLAMAPFPYIFFRYGSQIRKKSRYAKSAS
ncbi:hypothetical protein MPDQ_007173 [Monascus purpureus]|uniref:Major facilitator superfamily (MFS) profile domain-containing protein n=1 Tax=Monascus purpureus TaxID=5098 RepID=A0A507QUX9_MONPU|nr:hypothetical protein MPDQ_007173 [Monascus purpureus]